MIRHAQRGFTIIELLISIVIFSVGLLALAGTSSMILTAMTTTKSRTVAANVAESRFDLIRATACSSRDTSSTVKTATTRGITEAWKLTRLARADDVTVAVTFLSNRQSRTENFKSYMPC